MACPVTRKPANFFDGPPPSAHHGVRTEAPRGAEGPLRGPREGEGPDGGRGARRHVPPGGHVLPRGGEAPEGEAGPRPQGGPARLLREAGRGGREGEPRDRRTPPG